MGEQDGLTGLLYLLGAGLVTLIIDMLRRIAVKRIDIWEEALRREQGLPDDKDEEEEEDED